MGKDTKKNLSHWGRIFINSFLTEISERSGHDFLTPLNPRLWRGIRLRRII